MKVIKRDNREADYDIETIRKAISKANKTVSKDHRIDDETIDNITNKIDKGISKLKQELVNVEDIQDLVEQELVKENCYEIAKSYILYRDKRTKERNKNSEIHKLMEEKLNASNVVNQNANLDEYSFGGRKGEMDSAYLKQEALDYYMSEKFAENHKKNRVYVHDLDSYALGMHNCLSIPFDVLLRNGVQTRQTFIRGARSVSAALQLVAVIMQLQSLQQFGGVSATHLDWTLVPYIRLSFFKHFKEGLKYIEGMSEKELKKFEEDLLNDN